MSNDFSVPSERKTYVTEFIDPQGRRRLSAVYETELDIDTTTGAIKETTRATKITTTDGQAWSVTDGQGNAPIHVGFCEVCPSPPVLGRYRHGMTTCKHLKLCARCGRVCCRRHRKRRGKRWLCPSCASTERIVGFLRRLFGRWE